MGGRFWCRPPINARRGKIFYIFQKFTYSKSFKLFLYHTLLFIANYYQNLNYFLNIMPIFKKFHFSLIILDTYKLLSSIHQGIPYLISFYISFNFL